MTSSALASSIPGPAQPTHSVQPWSNRMVKKPLRHEPAGLRRLLNIEDVMSILQVGRSTIYALMHGGHLSAVHIGRALRFHPDDVQACILRRAEQHVRASRSQKRRR